ncbi:MAG: T9SS type A sorting domain-containing protein, partial [Chloroherpetonaceae bacterium]
VIPKEYKWEKAGNYVFPPHSFTILAIPRNSDTSVNSDTISFNIYPNPTNDYINIQYNPPTSSPAIVSIIDILGVERLSRSLDGTSANNVLDISFLPPGFYYLRISLGTNVYNSKIIKN